MGGKRQHSRIFNAEEEKELQKCAACGVCHSVCPVYNLTGDDTLSARGKIHLLKALESGELEPGKTGRDIFSRCLLCYACETACPSGVKASDLWIKARNYFSENTGRSIKGTAIKAVSGRGSLPVLMKLGKVVQHAAPKHSLGAGHLRPLLSDSFLLDTLPYSVPAKVDKKLRVGYFVGCVSNFFLNNVGLSAISVLSKLGCEVIIPKEQVCCGAPAFNNGEMNAARKLAEKNISAFLKCNVDVITSADATCGGSFRHEYRQLVGDHPDYEEFSDKYREIHGLVLELGLPEKIKTGDLKVTYHDSCHLRHTQGVKDEPRKLLKMIPGLELREMEESEMCCGFGGSYSLFYAKDAVQISADKIKNALKSGAGILAAGSPGCMLKLMEEARISESDIKVMHTMEILDDRL